ncbi:ATP-dependent Clp protease adapter ClpS [Microvirgula aerodenitrificans]|uniref:ATP-dependent Clp protease adapter ClpS n=1 Tax=Microvirgula aerodenitrificans TaxID=57480 RepID=UPI00248E7D20|nr:ATP-dependent Clp protease adapter ClpS [Microvirgula aerodenitrificans]
MPNQHQPGAELAPERTRLAPPPMYKVVLLNDDFTPMDFVIIVLERFFHMDREHATQVMLKVHTEGRGVCGVYSKDVASTKVVQVTEYAKVHQHPLQCVMEENQ